MTVWLVRAGGHGQFQNKFITEERVYVTWDGLDVDLSKLRDRDALIAAVEDRYPGNRPKSQLKQASQIWPFAHEMKKGDWIVLSLKHQRAIQIGELTGDYAFEDGLLLRKDLHAHYDAELLTTGEDGSVTIRGKALAHYGDLLGTRVKPLATAVGVSDESEATT